MDLDAAPDLVPWKHYVRLIISVAAADDVHLVSPVNQGLGQFSQVLARGCHIGVKGLVEQEKSHLQVKAEK